MYFDFNVFFFKQKTAYEFVSRDWSSDVCSSDLIEAGRKAHARFAAKETADHARNGLGHLTQVAEPERSKLRMHLQFLLALAKSAKDGFGSAEALDAFTQSFELAEAAGDRRIFQRSAQGLFAAQQAHANFDMAASYGAHIHQLIAKGHPAADATRGASLADHMIGVARTWQGRFAEARFRLRRGLGLSDDEIERRLEQWEIPDPTEAHSVECVAL